MSQESTTEALPGNDGQPVPAHPRVNLSGREADEVTLRRALTVAVNALALLVAAKNEKEANGQSARYRELKDQAWPAARNALAIGRSELGA